MKTANPTVKQIPAKSYHKYPRFAARVDMDSREDAMVSGRNIEATMVRRCMLASPCSFEELLAMVKRSSVRLRISSAKFCAALSLLLVSRIILARHEGRFSSRKTTSLDCAANESMRSSRIAERSLKDEWKPEIKFLSFSYARLLRDRLPRLCQLLISRRKCSQLSTVAVNVSRTTS